MICELLLINFELSKISNINSGSECTKFVLHKNALKCGLLQLNKKTLKNFSQNDIQFGFGGKR